MSRWMAAAMLVAAMAAATVANAADKLVLQLHGPAQFEFAGYYAALWKGFYREAGLTVDIKPGAARGHPPIDPVREVTDGRAQFGTGTADLVVRTAQGQPLLLLAPIFQQSGAQVYYRAEADFPSPAALTKAKLGRLPASDILDIELATALRAEGIDPAKLKSVPLEPGQGFAALMDRNAEAVIGSAWELPWLAREKGVALKSFNPADYRVEFYGDTLFTLRRLATAEPQTVRAFRAASLKGWEYALQHPEEIVTRLGAELTHPAGISDWAGFARYQADLAKRLARFPEVALGHSNPERWNRMQASMIAANALLRTADSDGFLYDPDAEARSRTDLRAFAILGAAALIGLGVLILLWLRWRRQPTPAADAETAEQAPAAALPMPTPTPAPAPAPVVPLAPPQPAPADLNAMLTGIERAIRQRVPRRASYRLSLLPELWPCNVDAPTVRALVLDLVRNAAADLKAGGELIVGTRNFRVDEAMAAATPGARIGEYARLTVRDDGPGLSEAALGRIFDPVATARPSAATAAERMRRLGGFARVESAEGVGTAIHLYFPRLAAAAEGAKAAAE